MNTPDANEDFTIPGCFDLRAWVVDTMPQYAEATRYLAPETQYAADLQQWTLAGKPEIDREQAFYSE